MLIAIQRLYRYFAPHGARWLIAAAALGFVHAIDAAIALALRGGVDALTARATAATPYAAALLALALFRLRGAAQLRRVTAGPCACAIDVD